jgi:hypothetical protein
VELAVTLGRRSDLAQQLRCAAEIDHLRLAWRRSDHCASASRFLAQKGVARVKAEPQDDGQNAPFVIASAVQLL